MKEKDVPTLNDRQIKQALAEELDRAAPRRDLWPSIRAEVKRRQSKPRRPWLLPPFGSVTILIGDVLAFRSARISLGSVAAALLLIWLGWSQPWSDSHDGLVRNASAYWYESGDSISVTGASSYDAFFEGNGVNPAVDTEHNTICKFAVDVDTASYTAARGSVMDGRLPEPGSVRVEEFINYFAEEYEPPDEGAFAIHVKGGPSPFGGADHWLISVSLRGRVIEGEQGQVIARDVEAYVDFNPELVSSYRQLGYEYQRVAYDDFLTTSMVAGEVAAGHSVTALYEMTFHGAAQGRVATVHVSYVDPETGDEIDISRDLDRREFSTSFEKASPQFQLDAVVAEYAEILRESYWAQGSSLAEVRRQAQRVGALLPDDPDVSELVSLAAQAEQVTTGTAIPKRRRLEPVGVG